MKRGGPEDSNDVLLISSDSSSCDSCDCTESTDVSSSSECSCEGSSSEDSYKNVDQCSSHGNYHARRQTMEDEIINVSDEEIGVSGGIITLDSRLKPSEDVELILQKYTKIRPPPMVRPHVRHKETNLRPIIIDGSNVSFCQGIFSGKKLEICVRVFQNAGHEVVAFMPQFRTMHSATREAEVLDELEIEGVLILTPSRSIEGQRVTPYDDRYVVEYAEMTGGVIVSRDNFCDLLKENEQWKKTILRRLKFIWLNDLILFPKYPLGSLSPTLKEFLKF